MDHQVYFNGKEFIPLHHPGETHALKTLGVKEDDALLQGRIYWKNHCVCLDCHSITTSRRVRLPDYFGSWRGRTEQFTMWAVVLVAAVAMICFRWSIYIVLALSLPVLITFDLLVTAIAKHSARRRANQLETELRANGMVHENGRCHRCEGTRLTDYLRFVVQHQNDDGQRGQPLRCPKCEQLQLYHDSKYLAVA